MTRQPAQHGQGQDHGADAEREIPQKDHPPIKVIADPAAERRPGAARGGKGDREIGVIFGAILWRGDIAQNHLRDRGQAAAAAALHDAAADQHQHAGRRRRQQRARHIDAERDQERRAPAVDIGEFAIERGQRRRGDQVGRDQPRQIVHVAERAADGRQRGRQDRLVDRAEKHRQHHADDDEPPVLVRKRLGRSRTNARLADFGVHERSLRCDHGCAALPAERLCRREYRQTAPLSFAAWRMADLPRAKPPDREPCVLSALSASAAHPPCRGKTLPCRTAPARSCRGTDGPSCASNTDSRSRT